MTSYREMYLHSTQHDHVGYHAHTDQLAFFKSFPPYRQQTILNLKAVNYGNESCTKTQLLQSTTIRYLQFNVLVFTSG